MDELILSYSWISPWDKQKMPVLFLGHGSPMNAIEENSFTESFQVLGQQLPRPKVILCISAHWCTRGIAVTAMENPRMIHDFWWFPPELYQVRYGARGSPELANKIKEILSPIELELDYTWWLDHGSWSVLRHIYPHADIPVVQMSLDLTRPPQYHFDVAKQLRPLRDEWILIVWSGNIIHNLWLVDFQNFNKDDYGYNWAREVQEKINRCILEKDYEPLIHYREQGHSFELAIPTPEHYLPLLYTLGLCWESDQVEIFNDKLVAWSLSMTSLIIGG